MDGLCELTARLHRTNSDYEIPEPDYELSSDEHEVKDIKTKFSSKMERENEIESEEKSITPDEIRKMMSKEQKELQKDLKIMHRRGIDLQSKRPEFKTKHHEIMSKGSSRKESQEVEQSELNVKLKSRSDVIKQAEEAKKIEDSKPEFMKISLKKGKGNTSNQ